MLRRTIPLGLLLMLVLGSVQAQNWIGVRSGYPLGVTFHYGIADAFAPGTDGRVSANLRIRNNIVNFGVGFDVLNTVNVEPPFEVYVGGGPAIDIGGGGAVIDLHGLVGGEFLLSDLDLEELGVFAEISLGAGIGIGRGSEFPRIGAGVGFNYYF